MKTTNTRKTTKTQLRDAVDAFRYTLDWVTGGTLEETIRQAPHMIGSLEEKSAKVSELLLNLSKPAAESGYLLEYAKQIPSRLASYRSRYINA